MSAPSPSRNSRGDSTPTPLLLLLLTVLLSSLRAEAATLSPTCASAVSAYAFATTANCSAALTALTSSTESAACVASPKGPGIDCFNPYTLMAQSSRLLVAPVTLAPSSAAAQCPLCAGGSLPPSCRSLLASLLAAVTSPSFPPQEVVALAAGNPAVLSAYSNVSLSCAAVSSDAVLLSRVRYQAEVLCGSPTAGINLASLSSSSPPSFDTVTVDVDGPTGPQQPSLYISGELDLRSLTQCGTCGVMPCTPGMLCLANTPPEMCPVGSYCPTPSRRLPCPEGHYCPLGTVVPIECRGIAAGSCSGEGNAREVVWIPLLVASLLFVALVGVKWASRKGLTPEWLTNALGAPRHSSHHHAAHTAVRQPPHAGPSPSPSPSRPGFFVTFSHLRLKTGNTVRLTDVSGTIRPGRVTAIMGGSGAGKTSLMNVLLGRERATGGDVRFALGPAPTDPKIPEEKLRFAVGFVPQNDIMLREMTVEQIVTHSACTRLPPSLTRDSAAVQARVEATLHQLQLFHLRHVGVEEGGLSVGDRKRINIAMELVADPSALFLDEPTSGLDASAAMNVAHIIRRIAASGCTVVAVVHQPRGEIFKLLDDLLLLVPGGKVAYQGPAQAALAFFARLGFSCAPQANRADFLLDLVSGVLHRTPTPAARAGGGSGGASSSSSSSTSGDDIEKGASAEAAEKQGDETKTEEERSGPRSFAGPVPDFAALWEGSGDAFLRDLAEGKVTFGHSPRLSGRAAGSSSAPPSPKALLPPPNPSTGGDVGGSPLALAGQAPSLSPSPALSSPSFEGATFLTQVWLVFKRALLQRLKGSSMIVDLLVNFVGGSVIGIVAAGGPLLILPIPSQYKRGCPPGSEVKCLAWLRLTAEPLTFYWCMTLGGLTVPAAVRAFGLEREPFWREAFTGLSPTAYYLGKMLADIPYFAITSFFFLAPMVAIAPWRGPVEGMYAICLVLAIFIAALSYALSHLFADPDAATLVGVIAALLLNLFGGFVPMIGNGAVWAYTRWVARAIVGNELVDGHKVGSLFDQLVPKEHGEYNFGGDLGNLLIFAAVTHLAAYILLRRTNRARKGVL